MTSKQLRIFNIVATTILIAGIGTVMVLYSKDQKILEEQLQRDNCKLSLVQPTGKKVYCGKACWRDEMRKEFTCDTGTRVFFE